jgi:protein disulfide-isomerase A6
MKPAWDKLEKEFASDKHVLVANVDCTADNAKDLCNTYGVRGYPTIKYYTGATGSQGEDYKGGREFDDLKKFVGESGTFGPSCGNDNKDLCSADQVAALEKFNAMTPEARAAEIAARDAEFAGFEETFKTEVEKLQATYQKLQEDKEANETKFKEDNQFLGILKGIKA